MYLLDTNICIYCIKNKPEIFFHNLQNIRINNGVYISAITIAELQFGIEKSKFPEKNRISLIEFISIFNILPFTDGDAEIFGKIKAKLSAQGNIIGSFDMLIAAQAIHNNFILVTNNTKEFIRLENLKLENWNK